MRKSRATTVVATQAGMALSGTREINAAAIMILSTSGSINFGKLMDPLVDKIMMAAAFISLVPLKAIPAWVATTVVARDFLITGLRMMASSKGHVLPAERLGKQKTSWQVVTVIFFLALLSMHELRYANETSTWWFRAWHEAGPILVWITVALTVYSGLGYMWRHRELISRSEEHTS